MQKGLFELLTKFRSLREARDGTIPPLLVSPTTALDIVDFFVWTKPASLDELKKEFYDNIFVFAPEESGDSFKIKLARDMSEKAHIRSSVGYKVFIALGINDLTLEAANSLLKVFEDIPEDTLFVLVSDNSKELLPDTVLSRVISIDSGEQSFVLDQKLQDAIRSYFQWDKAALHAWVFAFFKKKRENPRQDVLAILQELLSSARDSNFTSKQIAALETAYLRAASTNANAKWVLDAALLSLI